MDGFPSQRVSIEGIDVFCDAGLNKLVNKFSSCRWFETKWRSCDVTVNGPSPSAAHPTPPSLLPRQFNVMSIRYLSVIVILTEITSLTGQICYQRAVTGSSHLYVWFRIPWLDITGEISHRVWGRWMFVDDGQRRLQMGTGIKINKQSKLNETKFLISVPKRFKWF